MDLGLQGRVALVTGASAGIGRGIARALAAEGARVALASRSPERIEAAARDVGGTPFVHDSADLDAVPALVAAVEAALGPVDVLVTNTGGPPSGPDPTGFSREQWQAAHRTLVLAPMALIEAVLPGMRARGWGRVLNVSSVSAVEPIDSLMLSTAHRGGMLGAFRTLARAAAGDGVTFNTVLPGRIATQRLIGEGTLEQVQERARVEVPAGRVGTVEELAAAAAFLCSAPASYVNGAVLPVDGALLHSA